MSALELLGPLLTLASGFDWCKFAAVRIWVDNSAAVHIWKKGYSTACPLSSTIVKAVHTIANGIGCNVDVEEITRCSTPGADMADALSKGHFLRFWSICNANDDFDLPLSMAWVPKQLMKWIMDPKDDDNLGYRILEEIAPYTPVLGLST